MSRVSIQVRDKSSEIGAVGVYLGDQTALDAWSVPDGLADAFAGHIDALSIGVIASVQFSQATQAPDDALPASAFAQRELGLRFYLRDQTTNKLNTLTVPAPDLGTIVVTPLTDLADLTAAPVAAFVSWLEANAKSDVGNAIAVEKAVVVGRNS